MTVANNTNTATKIVLLTSTKSIETAIEKMYNDGQKLQTTMHVLACSVLKHLGQHKDIRVLHKLLNAIPEFGRVNALRAWFEEFGPVVFTGNNPALVSSKSVRLGDAMAKPFWKFRTEKPYEAVDVVAMIESMRKKLLKDATETKRDHGPLIKHLDDMKRAAIPAPAN